MHFQFHIAKYYIRLLYASPKMNFFKILATLLSKNLINLTTRIFRSASNTFGTADFVYISEQEILPPKSTSLL